MIKLKNDDGISMKLSRLEFRIVDRTIEQSLVTFFRDLKTAGDDKYFHPHPLSDVEAKKRTKYSGKDLYYVLFENNEILGYGMLRGWDEGYDVPSLGIVIHPSIRGFGFGKLFVHFLHLVARQKGASKVRLKVYPDNASALSLYKKLGYTFQTEEEGEFIGHIQLKKKFKSRDK